MASLPPETTMPDTAIAHARRAAATGGAIAQAWAELHDKARPLALLARIAAEPEQAQATLAPLLATARPWQHMLAMQGIEDMAALLDSGLAALATLSGRGQDASAPALALWREFHAARAAVLTVLQPADPAS